MKTVKALVEAQTELRFTHDDRAARAAIEKRLAEAQAELTDDDRRDLATIGHALVHRAAHISAARRKGPGR